MTTGEFIGMLLHAGTIAHIFHLRSRSYAQHVALGDFYEGIVEKADNIAECIQAGGIIEDYPQAYTAPLDSTPLVWLAALSSAVAEGREDLPQDSEIQNLVDEAVALIDRTIYKLRFLA